MNREGLSKAKANSIIFSVPLLLKLAAMYTQVNWRPDSLKKKGREGKPWAAKLTGVRQYNQDILQDMPINAVLRRLPPKKLCVNKPQKADTS